jgi:glycosyltransferase involved in cell wall biosynthesis
MSTSKKIAIVSAVFPPYRGGIGTVAQNHARLLAQQGNRVTVFTPQYHPKQNTPPPVFPPKAGGQEGVGGLSAEALYSERRRGGRVSYDTKLLTPIFKYGNAAYVPQLCKKLKGYDVVILQYPFFGGMRSVYQAKKKYGFKLIVNYNMDVVGSGPKGLIFKYTTKYFLPKLVQIADIILASSTDYARHSDLGVYWKEGNPKFKILPNGVDTEKFKPERINDEFKRNLNISDEKVILFVGGLDKAHYFKGVDYLIRAIPYIDFQEKFKVIIAGRGELQNEYRKLAVDLGVKDRVLFTGGVSDSTLVKLYQLAAVTVLPSIDQSESFGIVLAESMACATPVISSNLPGVRNVYEDGVSGFTVPARDEKALAKKIEFVLTHSGEMNIMGLAGRKLVENKYNWNTIGNTLTELIQITS